jgi:hypothetical protein
MLNVSLATFCKVMFSELSLAPRYCLDDESPWLRGIDPLRRYWICVNGDPRSLRVMSGLATQSEAALKRRCAALEA